MPRGHILIYRPLVALLGLALLALAAPAGAEGTVTLAAVGDVQLGRGVGKVLAARGFEYPWADVRSLVSGADLSLLNVECALSAHGVPIAKRYSFPADPRAAGGVARAGFDVAVLANNHSLDCGRDGLVEAEAVLHEQGLATVGAGATEAEAEAPLMLTRNGLRIAILARTFVLPDGLIYREDVPTVAVYDPDRIAEEVRAARAQADIVVVSLHWGVEYTRQPQESQRRIARALVDAGATLVVGHHTHTPQPVERYRQGLIAYSLGNFVFDPVADRAAHGLLLTCTLARGKVENYRVTPVRIENGRPSLSGER